MTNLSPRAARIKAAGIALFGERGQTRMSESIGISKQMLSFIMIGDRPVTDEVYHRVAEALAKEADRLRAVALKMDKLAHQIVCELE